jgi:hypothetical protein
MKYVKKKKYIILSLIEKNGWLFVDKHIWVMNIATNASQNMQFSSEEKKQAYINSFVEEFLKKG